MSLGYPQEDAAIVALKTIRNFLEHDHNLVNCLFIILKTKTKKYFFV